MDYAPLHGALPYRLPSLRAPLRVAFVGQSTFFRACALEGDVAGLRGTFVEHRGGGDTNALLASLAAHRAARRGRLPARDRPARGVRLAARRDRRLPHRAAAAARRQPPRPRAPAARAERRRRRQLRPHRRLRPADRRDRGARAARLALGPAPGRRPLLPRRPPAQRAARASSSSAARPSTARRC